MKPFSFHFAAMNTPCELQLFVKDEHQARALYNEVRQQTLALEKKYSFFDANSFLNTRINQRQKAKVKLDFESLEVLTQVKELSKASNYNFDITLGTLKACYKEHKNLEGLRKGLEQLIDKTGFHTWELKGKYLHFQHPQTRLDLGGVIKEYAVDKAAKFLQKQKLQSALINFGGDIYALGHKPDGSAFNIGIKNPKDKENYLFNIAIANQALTTSAHYERNHFIEGEMFSHIISLHKHQSDILSATVVSESALMSGIFSTSFMIDAQTPLLEHLKVALIDKELQLHQNLTH